MIGAETQTQFAPGRNGPRADEVPRRNLQIVNPDPRYRPITLTEPSTRGYIHVAAEVHPPRLPFLPTGREKAQLLARLKDTAHQLEQLDAVETVSVFDAIAIAPARSPYLAERASTIRVARFDVVVLIETTSPATVCEVQNTPAYQSLLDDLSSSATHLHVMAARNAKRIADVDKSRQGTFLFNYFVADNAEVMLRLWDYLAEWYAAETGLDNSTLLVPLDNESSDYLAINNARWDESLPRVMFRQLSKKSFRTYVLANLEANRVGAMPILYRLANGPRGPVGRLSPWMITLGVAAAGAILARRRQRRTGYGVSGKE